MHNRLHVGARGGGGGYETKAALEGRKVVGGGCKAVAMNVGSWRR